MSLSFANPAAAHALICLTTQTTISVVLELVSFARIPSVVRALIPLTN
jgi:hypothetical protein